MKKIREWLKAIKVKLCAWIIRHKWVDKVQFEQCAYCDTVRSKPAVKVTQP